MNPVKRYAVYMAPPENDPLTLVAESWLGRSAFGRRVSAQTIADTRQGEWIASARRYGFHATMKPPFRLASGMDEQLLLDAFKRYCGQTASAGATKLEIGRIGPFFALVPNGEAPQLGRLADSAVEWFEPFRATLSPAEVERRQLAKLSERQRDYLMRWGYPYVFEEFRFHMTLTGPIEADERDRVQALLEAHFGLVLDEPQRMDGMGLFEETRPGGTFEVLAWGRLTGDKQER